MNIFHTEQRQPLPERLFGEERDPTPADVVDQKRVGITKVVPKFS